MATRLRYSKGYQFFDANGEPLALGMLYYYVAGTTAAQNTYADSSALIPNTNPIILDGSGRLLADVYLGASADYKEVLTTSTGSTVAPWPADNILRAGQADWNATGGPSQVLNKPVLATVATSGNYNDLSNRPTAIGPFGGDTGSGGTSGLVPAPAAGTAVANKFLKADGTWATPPGATGSAATNLGLTASATSVGITSSTGAGATISAATASSAGVLDSARAQKIDGLAAVATSGSYNDLTNKPSIPAAAVDMAGDTGSGGVHGLVPAPAAGTAAAGKFLKADGTWAVPAGNGSSTTNLGVTLSPTQIALTSSTGSGTAIPLADTSNAGAMGPSDRATLNGLGTASMKSVAPTGNASTSQVVLGSDTRLVDSRSPLAHAASHASGGSDTLSIAASQVSGIPASLSGQNLDGISRLGIGTTDAVNSFSVSAPTALFSNSGDLRVTMSKGGAANTAAFNFQDNFSTRVQLGLLGNDSFTIATSPDGSTFKNAIVANTGGAVSFPNSTGFVGDSGSGGAVGLVPAPPSGSASAGKFLKADGTWTVPPTGASYSAYGGATSGASGSTGLVPAPTAGQQSYVLSGSGAWIGQNALSIAASQVTGLAASATTDATNASNITSGTLAAAQIPAPTVSARGGVKAASAATNQFQTGIDTTGTPLFSQPTFSNLAGSAAASQLPMFGSAAAGIVPSSGGGTSNFLRADGTWTPPSVGGSSVMGGATASSAGTSGLVPAPSSGQQNLFLRGDATFADPGSTLGHFSFRDATLSGFTGAEWDISEIAGSTSNTGAGTAIANLTLNSGEIAHISITWCMALSDISKTAAGVTEKGYKYVSGTLSPLSYSGTPTNYTLRDSSNPASVSFTTNGTQVGIVILTDGNTWNYFLLVRILRMKTSS